MDELKSIPCSSCDGYGNLPMPHEGICSICKGTGEVLEKYPLYVRFAKGSALRLKGATYYRDAGLWDVEFKVVNGFLLATSPHEHLDNAELFEIPKEEWEKDNRGYI